MLQTQNNSRKSELMLAGLL